MNGLGTALQRCGVAGVVAVALWGMGAVGLPLAQAGASRLPTSVNARGSRAPLAAASVVGGQSAQISEFPFQVALYDPRVGPPAKSFFCGGVILDATHVATAAHCLVGEGGQRSAPGEIAVLAGSSQLAPVEAGSVSDPAAEVSVDPSYRPVTSDYDVGIVDLGRPLWAGATPALDGHDAIAPLAPDPALARARSAAALEGGANGPVPATVSGWGEESPEPGSASLYPLHLRKARIALVPSAFCAEAYATIEQIITPRMMCASGDAGGTREDSCYGDSGGPLVSGEPGATAPAGDALLGLVDFGDGCAQAGYPGVYLNTSDPAIASFLQSGAPQPVGAGVGRTLRLCPLRSGHRHHHTASRRRRTRRCRP